MVNYLMIFRSLTYAQKAGRLLESAGISAIILRAPLFNTEEGCSFAVKVAEKSLTSALSVLTSSGMPPAKVFSVYKDGSIGRAVL